METDVAKLELHTGGSIRAIVDRLHEVAQSGDSGLLARLEKAHGFNNDIEWILLDQNLSIDLPSLWMWDWFHTRLSGGVFMRCRKCVRTISFQQAAPVWTRESHQACDATTEAVLRVKAEMRINVEEAARPHPVHALEFVDEGVVVCRRCGYWSGEKWQAFAKQKLLGDRILA